MHKTQRHRRTVSTQCKEHYWPAFSSFSHLQRRHFQHNTPIPSHICPFLGRPSNSHHGIHRALLPQPLTNSHFHLHNTVQCAKIGKVRQCAGQLCSEERYGRQCSKSSTLNVAMTSRLIVTILGSFINAGRLVRDIYRTVQQPK
jgi:hypothetical protein